jgi:hypothetical protein
VWRSWLRWAIFGVLILATGFLPFALRSARFADIRRRAMEGADDDWAKGKPSIYSDAPSKLIDLHGTVLDTEYDVKTGLRLHWTTSRLGFIEAYNERTTQLIAEHGLPDPSMARFLAKPEDFLALLDSDRFDEIRKLPYDVGNQIRIDHEDAIRRNRKEIGGDPKTVWISTKPSGDRILGPGTPYVGRLPNFPKMVFVRLNKSWIGAFREDGQFIAQATRYEKPAP